MLATYSSLVGLAVGGKYELRRVLGAGGMGVVCEAVHLDLGKRVAVKLIDKSMKESELIVTRFRREARAAGQIDSEHIVDVHDVGADPRVGLYMVMEYLVGEDLQSRLERDRRLDVRTGVMIAHQIARGLARAHAAGVIHRDLKPANVYLTHRDNGQMLVKLLDFGVSKLLNDAPSSARITGSGTPIGTPLYMSPEQAEGKDDVDGRADIWSLGAVVYEALTGVPPFADRGTYHATLMGILTSRPRLLHDAAPWVPADIAKVVDDMLVHDRTTRIPDAATVTKRLLDAYPEVLSDGTGNYTAVIVPQSAASVDATGDTEFFTASSVPPALSSRPGAAGSNPSSRPLSNPSSNPLSNPLSNPPSNPISGIRDESTRTLPHSNDASRTASATPVDVPAAIAAAAYGAAQTPRSGPKTVPLAPTPRPSEPGSSAPGGVSLPRTPAAIDPIPGSEMAPPTERDDALALRADRKRGLTRAATFVIVALVAVGAFLAGRRVPSPSPPPTVAKAAAPPAVASDATPAPKTPSDLPPAPSASSPVIAEGAATAAPSASAASSAKPARPPRRKPRAPAAPTAPAPAPPTDETPATPPEPPAD